MNIKNSKILIVVAHPDDEVIGMGGTIKKLTQNGCQVTLCIFTDGVSSRNKHSKSDVITRKKQCIKSSKLLGISNIDFNQFPDNALYKTGTLELSKSLNKITNKYKPDYIFTHHYGDLNIDHRLIFETVMICARPKPKSKLKGIFLFEVASSTDWFKPTDNFKPNFFIDISKTYKHKEKALKLYESEIYSDKNFRSYSGIKILNEFRGFSKSKNISEAFEILYLVDQ